MFPILVAALRTEPSSLVLLAVALFGIARAARRKPPLTPRGV